MPEHRSCPRWQVNKQAQIKLSCLGPAAINCNLRDISYKGLQVHLGRKLPRDSSLKLIVVLSAEFILNVEAWVSWHKNVSGINAYGLYFSKIDGSGMDRIYRFIHKYKPEQINQEYQQQTEKGGTAMHQEQSKDSRIFARFLTELSLRFLNLATGKEGKAETHDISANGLGIVTPDYLEPNARLEVWLGAPDKGEPLYTRGKVVWSKRESWNVHRCGISLEKADLMGVSRVLRTI